MKTKLQQYNDSIAEQFKKALQIHSDAVSFEVTLAIEHPYNEIFLQDAADKECKADKKYSYQVRPASSGTFGSKASNTFQVHIMRRKRRGEDNPLSSLSGGMFGLGTERPTKASKQDIFSDSE